MKIRTDYVTNSSSVSYIITMHEGVIEDYIKQYEGKESAASDVRIAKALQKYMHENGSISFIDECELYMCLMKFMTDGDCMSKDAYEELGQEADPIKMNEKDLFDYIRGEYICNGKLGEISSGFGQTRVG